jgi:hypothetical protein
MYTLLRPTFPTAIDTAHSGTNFICPNSYHGVVAFKPSNETKIQNEKKLDKRGYKKQISQVAMRGYKKQISGVAMSQ